MKKALSIAGRVLTILLLIFAVFVMVFTVISVSTVGKADADFLGFKPNIVLSDSMQDTFAVGGSGGQPQGGPGEPCGGGHHHLPFD